MQAIEFEAIPEQHTIRIPEDIPDGVPLRVLLLWESPLESDTDFKNLFASVTEGLTDEDLSRPRDLAREETEWVSDRYQRLVGASEIWSTTCAPGWMPPATMMTSRSRAWWPWSWTPRRPSGN